MYLTIEMTTQSEYKSHSSLLHLFLMYPGTLHENNNFVFEAKKLFPSLLLFQDNLTCTVAEY